MNRSKIVKICYHDGDSVKLNLYNSSAGSESADKDKFHCFRTVNRKSRQIWTFTPRATPFINNKVPIKSQFRRYKKIQRTWKMDNRSELTALTGTTNRCRHCEDKTLSVWDEFLEHVLKNTLDNATKVLVRSIISLGPMPPIGVYRPNFPVKFKRLRITKNSRGINTFDNFRSGQDNNRSVSNEKWSSKKE